MIFADKEFIGELFQWELFVQMIFDIMQQIFIKTLIFFGAGWFNEKQNKAYKEAMEALKKNPTVDLENSYVPLDNPYIAFQFD